MGLEELRERMGEELEKSWVTRARGWGCFSSKAITTTNKMG